MGKEIERKFLVKGEFKNRSVRRTEITQAYLSVDPERVVRIRIAGNEASLTIKTAPRKASLIRNEWEIPIKVSDAREMLDACLPGRILKTRYVVPSGNHNYEVDVFHGRHTGLVIAEIEIAREDEEILIPDWIGEEVTGKPEYYNSNLIRSQYL